MVFFKRFAWLALVLALVTVGARLVVAQQPAPQQQDEFVPIEQLPPQDQLPAAPLLIGAYAFVMLAVFGYLYSLGRRLSSVKREIDRLETDLKRSSRG